MSPDSSAILLENDPFKVLRLDPSNPKSTDKKEIKRAYRRLALKYHPDVLVSNESTPEQKKEANDVFAKINWAYEILSGKDSNASSNTAAGKKTTTSSGSSSYGPPHRRSGGGSSRPSVDWEDFMPKYNEEDFDTGGDSFGAIFSDLFTGAAAGVAGVGGGNSIFGDFVDFLEQNLDVGTSGDDASWDILIRQGSLDDIANEMDDTDLAVQQLDSKLNDIDKEIVMLNAELNQATRYVEKMNAEEKIAELRARKKVAENYMNKARKRLLTLQTRYKEMIVDGQDDTKARGRSSSSWSEPSRSNPSSTSGTYSSTTSTSRDATSERSRSTGGTEREGFGSFGRRRTSRRRTTTTRETRRETRREARSRDTTRSTTSNSGSSTSTSNRSSSSNYESRVIPTSKPTPTTSYDSSLPPHRRTRSTRSDSQRLRELEVDDEFEKLKKDLGL